MAGESRRAVAWTLAAAGAVVGLDQLTKHLAVAAVRAGEPVELLFGFELSNVRNEGVAFGLFAGDGTPVLVLTLAALALLLFHFARHTTRPYLWLAVGLLVGGALGNLADRVRIEAVIDFLDPPLWPAFNLADVSIVVGVGILALILLAPGELDER